MVTTTTNLVRLSVGRFTVGLGMDRVLGIERGDRVKPQPTRPDLAGRLVNRAGEWPVLDLAARLGLPPTTGGQVVLTAVAGERHGLLVDRVSPIARLSTADVRPVPRSVAGGVCFAGLLMLDGQPLPLLDPDRLTGGDLFAAETDELPTPPRISARNHGSNRLLVIGQTQQAGRTIGFGLPAGCVSELIDAPPGTPLPGTPDHVRDVSAWRGRPLPVLDLAAWCGLPATDGRRVVVVRTARDPIGLLAGPTVRVLPLPLPHVPSRRPLALNRNHVLGLFDTNDLTLVVPDLTKLTRN